MLRVGIEARKPFESFDKSWGYFNGDFWPVGMPRWKSRITVNMIRSFILFMQAAMTDNKPRFTVRPSMPGTEHSATMLGKLGDRQWYVTGSQHQCSLAALHGLIFGTGFVKAVWDPSERGGKGGIVVDEILPYRLYFSPNARSVKDSEFVIQHERKSIGWVARGFPDKAKRVRKFAGGSNAMESESAQRDLINEGGPGAGPRKNIHTAASMDGHLVRMPRNGEMNDPIDQELIDVYEFWYRDDIREEYEKQEVIDGVPQFEYVMDADGFNEMEETGEAETVISPIDGMPLVVPKLAPKRKPKMVTAKRFTFPNGRLALVAGEVLLRDIPNPFQIDGWPFADWRDVDTGIVWGQGEPLNLKDANIGANRTLSQTYDNINLAGNTSWLVHKNSGINPDFLRNRPAAIIPVEGDIQQAMKAVEKPQISGESLNLFNVLFKVMPGLAGLSDAIMGATPAANTAFATIDQLQESGAAILRQKVRNFEQLLERLGRIIIALIQQYDEGEAPLRDDKADNNRYEAVYGESDPETGEKELMAVVVPNDAVAVSWTHYSNAMLQGPIEFEIVADSSLSTSPSGMFNKLMTLFDKKIVDQQYVVDKLNLEDGDAVVKRMKAEAMMQAQMKKKPGPKPKSDAPSAARRANQPPTSHLPSARANAAVR